MVLLVFGTGSIANKNGMGKAKKIKECEDTKHFFSTRRQSIKEWSVVPTEQLLSDDDDTHNIDFKGRIRRLRCCRRRHDETNGMESNRIGNSFEIIQTEVVSEKKRTKIESV